MTQSANGILPAAGRTSANPKKTKWFPSLAAGGSVQLRLFCFPYAGGDAVTIFRKWPQQMPAGVEVCAVQLPGRGMRVAEPLYTDLVSVVKAAADAFQDHLDKPFALFGHSMGAMMAFEFSRRLRRQYGIEPEILFVSGRAAPQIPDPDPPNYNLPEPEFLEEVNRMDGTPPEAFANTELMRFLLPILRADFQICQTHAYASELPLSCPITAFGGLNDSPSREDLEAWRAQTSNRFSLHMFAGNHFFLRTEESSLLRILASRLDHLATNRK